MLSVNNKEQSGFTLIELMVAVSIMGILATLISASLILARKQGRDARRRSDMQQYRVALENYYAVNNNYPTSTTGNGTTCSSSGVFSSSGPLYSFLNNTIILDPLNSGSNCYFYYGDTSGTAYKIYGPLESGNYWMICSGGKSGLYTSGTAPSADANCDLP